MKTEMETLILKYLDCKASASEEKALLSWLKESEENRKTFFFYYDMWSLKVGKNFNCDKALEKILRPRRLVFRSMYRYAAAVAAAVLIVAAGIWGLDYYSSSNQTIRDFVAKDFIQSKNGDKIILSLGDKDVMKFSSKFIEIAYDNGEILIDNARTIKQTSATYNQMLIPEGKKGKLTLSDGSRIWIKSGTRITYPIKMSKKTREVFVDGEVYLEVAHNAQKPFIVNTKDMNVRVTGTQFDVAAYFNEPSAKVALIKGGVDVSREKGDGRITHLSPDQLYTSYGKGKEKVEDVDAKKYMAWVNDIYVCDNEKMSIILTQLSKLYGKKITCDKSVADMHCSGELDLTKSLGTVLSDFREILSIDYETDDRGNLHVFKK